MGASGITAVVYPPRWGRNPMVIFERELALMDKAGAIESFIGIERQDKKRQWFELAVRFVDQDTPYTITNARQSPRKWAQVNTLINFLGEQCPKYVSTRFEAGEPALSLIIGVNTKEIRSDDNERAKKPIGGQKRPRKNKRK